MKESELWDSLLRSNTADPDHIVTWIRWLILRIGPDAFFKQWTSTYSDTRSSSVNDVADVAWHLWYHHDQALIKECENIGREVDTPLRLKCLQPELAAEAEGLTWAEYQGLLAPFHPGEQHVEAALLDIYFLYTVQRIRFDDAPKIDAAEEKMRKVKHPFETVPFFVYLGRWSRVEDFEFTMQTIRSAMPDKIESESDEENVVVYIEGVTES